MFRDTRYRSSAFSPVVTHWGHRLDRRLPIGVLHDDDCVSPPKPHSLKILSTTKLSDLDGWPRAPKTLVTPLLSA